MKQHYKKLLSFIFLFIFFTGCSSLEDFNKGLNNFNQKLSNITGTPLDSGSSGSTSSKGGKVVPLNIDTGGKGKFENFKVRVTSTANGGDKLYFSGFYTNTSQKTQTVVLEFDIINEYGVRKRGEFGRKSFIINDVRPGERINIERDTPNTIANYSDEHVDLNSMRAYYH